MVEHGLKGNSTQVVFFLRHCVTEQGIPMLMGIVEEGGGKNGT